MRIAEHILRPHVWIVATAVPLLVRLCPMHKLLHLATPRRPWRLYAGLPPERICRTVQARLAHPQMMRRRPCLRKGLTLYHFLRLADVPAVLNIGAWPPSRDPRRLHTHCWVTVDDEPIAEADPEGIPPGVLISYGGR
jgi:hypothetical protein